MRATSAFATEDHFDVLPYVAVLLILLGALLLVTLGLTGMTVGMSVDEQWVVPRRGDGHGKTPVLVEWDGRDLMVHAPDGQQQVPWMSDPGDLGRHSEAEARGRTYERSEQMKQLLKWFAERRATHYPLFAVRPSGFEDFRAMSNDFRREKISVGFDAISQSRPVTLKLQETRS